MADLVKQDTDQFPRRPKSRLRLVKCLVILLAVVFIVWELYTLSTAVRVGVVNVLGWFGPPAMPLVLEFTRDDSPVVQVATYEVLVRAKRDAVPILEQSLTHPEASRRQLAAELLGRIGGDAADALPALVETGATDPEFRVRKAAIEALKDVGASDERAVPALVGLLDDGDPEIRKTVLMSLRHFGPRAKEAVPALITRLQDANAQVRRETAEVLEQIGPDARAAIPALTAALEDPHPDVRREAQEALDSIRPVPP